MKVALFRDLPTEGWPSMERYADELAGALRGLGFDVREFAPSRPLPALGGLPGALANYAWRTLAIPPAARRAQADVNHIIDHSYAHLLGALDPGRTVVTCHDLAPLALDVRGRGLSHYLWDRAFRAMSRAAHIIAVSAYTRDELIRRSAYPPERISVAHSGVGAGFFAPPDREAIEALRQRHGLAGRRVLLHVGSCLLHKNVETILRALPALRDLRPAFAQVGGRFSRAQAALMDSLRLRADVLRTGRVGEPELRAWYHLADLLVLPSTYEGFGLPVLEALASGLPVVCSRAAALPEAAGQAALYFDPRDPEALAGQVRLALTDSGLRTSLVEAGRARAREFTWERTAQRTAEAYARIAG